MILLTGATGFLGSRLCVELLDRTDSEIACIVRASSTEEAAERVRNRLCKLNPGRLHGRRLRCVPGDITQSRLGLEAATYTALRREVSEVFHCGASVNMAAPYAHLAPVNVGGTAEVLEFCRTGSEKTLHHVSTLGVFLTARAAHVPVVDEQTVPTVATSGPLGYPRSKYEAETLVARAVEEGLRATIHRPGVILADSRTGEGPTDDFIARVLAAAVLTGCHPRTLGSFPVIPVDLAAAMIAALALAPGPSATAFHLMLPEPLPAAELFTWEKDVGYRLREVSAEEWQATLKAQGRNRVALAMRALSIAHYGLGLFPDKLMPQYRCEATTKAALGLGVTSAPPDAPYVARLFQHLIDRQVLPPVRN